MAASLVSGQPDGRRDLAATSRNAATSRRYLADALFPRRRPVDRVMHLCGMSRVSLDGARDLVMPQMGITRWNRFRGWNKGISRQVTRAPLSATRTSQRRNGRSADDPPATRAR
jgi:hypothetical protein